MFEEHYRAVESKDLLDLIDFNFVYNLIIFYDILWYINRRIIIFFFFEKHIFDIGIFFF